VTPVTGRFEASEGETHASSPSSDRVASLGFRSPPVVGPRRHDSEREHRIAALNAVCVL